MRGAPCRELQNRNLDHLKGILKQSVMFCMVKVICHFFARGAVYFLNGWQKYKELIMNIIYHS